MTGVYPSNITLQDSYRALRQLLQYQRAADEPDQVDIIHDESLDAQELEERAAPFRATARKFHGGNGSFGMFCVTRRRYLGVVPRVAEVDDVLYIFSGMKSPFCLGNATDQRELTALWGQAYVHGLMYGEAFERGVSFKIDGQQIHSQMIALH